MLKTIIVVPSVVVAAAAAAVVVVVVVVVSVGLLNVKQTEWVFCHYLSLILFYTASA